MNILRKWKYIGLGGNGDGLNNLSKGENKAMAYIDIKDLMIDKEFESLLPSLSQEDYNILEQSLLKNGFDQKFGRIKVWYPKRNDGKGYIVDGHNRFKICKEYGIKLRSGDFEQVKFDSRDDVKKYMFENQLARRNLSIVDKYEIVERYCVMLKMIAKKNQSDGGKGFINITRIDVRKEKAKMTGISEGSYSKLDKIMKSNNEDVKWDLRNKHISIDKAYQIVNNSLKEKKNATHQQQIQKLHDRISEIDKSIGKLNKEKEQILKKLNSIYEILDIRYLV